MKLFLKKMWHRQKNSSAPFWTIISTTSGIFEGIRQSLIPRMKDCILAEGRNLERSLQLPWNNQWKYLHLLTTACKSLQFYDKAFSKKSWHEHFLSFDVINASFLPILHSVTLLSILHISSILYLPLFITQIWNTNRTSFATYYRNRCSEQYSWTNVS